MLRDTLAHIVDRILGMEPFTIVLWVTGIIGVIYSIRKRRKEPIGHSVQKLDLFVDSDRP